MEVVVQALPVLETDVALMLRLKAARLGVKQIARKLGCDGEAGVADAGGHRHRYYGVLAPNAPLRQAVTAMATAPSPPAAAPNPPPAEPAPRRAARYAWAQLLARIYERFRCYVPSAGRR